ncbi:MAG: (deoxy)nucleoside triphosphate pyrophosphohydrolase [Actinomycetota bacterium]|nr:(deoxy)nucleoside triphosphate pyrophosphohydrolase [Actinomycetota bacterium]
MKRHIDVVGAVIVQDGLILCAQRGGDSGLAGLWEFPGGKIESGESKQAALKREITEELQCTIEVGPEVVTTLHEYEHGSLTLTTYYCHIVQGTPQLTEHSSMKWLRPDELDALEWAPADIPAIAQLRIDLN